jgi:hypothetical protein
MKPLFGIYCYLDNFKGVVEMGNQQPRALRTLCINAKLGDGYFWKHLARKYGVLLHKFPQG